jgi:thiosulfate/3-mercaptopyruvate sulfurtransferase
MATSPVALDTRVEGYARPGALVSCAWVRAHLSDPAVRVVSTEEEESRSALLSGVRRAPGAVTLSWWAELQDPIRRDVLNREDFEVLMAGKGISNDTTVVLCGESSDPSATYVFWLLTLYGHVDVRIMDGGRRRWEQEGRFGARRAAMYPSVAYTAPAPDLSVRAYRDEVLRQMEAGRPLLDVRSPAEYRGEIAQPRDPGDSDRREGHIPGARNIPWDRALRPADGSFKGAAELRADYQGKHDIWPDEEIICYSRTGQRASHTWFVLTQLLGYPDVKSYDGSWSEWGSLIAAPIER